MILEKAFFNKKLKKKLLDYLKIFYIIFYEKYFRS